MRTFFKIMFLSLLGGLCPSVSHAAVNEEESPPIVTVDEESPVDLTADTLENDEANQTVTASGNVELIQAGRILRADKVTYNLQSDLVTAQGNVVLNEPTGETYFADYVELRDKLKDGFATGIRGLLTDGGRFSASEGQRITGTKLVMEEATYTACEPCKNNPDKAPVWQLVASKVTHDETEKRIIYENARMEMFGVPVMYTPYFSHPDGSVEQKSGFLPPSLGFDSELGTSYSQEYYWAVAPDKDVTIGAMIPMETNPLVTGEYRQRFNEAEITLSGGVTYSDRFTPSGGQNEEVRGHVIADGLWDLNQNWRAGFDTEWASDDQYMRQYNFLNEDVLENRVYAERFSGRNYAVVQGIAFQDIRISDRQEDQPGILPEVKASFLGEPNETLGGRWSLDLSALSLNRTGGNQDLTRGSLEAGWERRLISDSGLVTKVSALGRSDAYSARDRDVSSVTPSRSDDSSEVRGFAQADIQTSYPLVNHFESFQMVFEPLVSLTTGSDIDVNDDIPNEDSEDIVIDAMNLFEPNRFTGYDRIEDRTRATYGVRTGLYGYNGYRGDIFLGQSYRFENDDNPFPQGSGLDDKDSDIVGQISSQFGKNLDFNYRFQLDNETLSSQRHEAEAAGQLGPLTFGSRYFYGVGLEGTDVEETREQLTNWGSYKLDDNWTLNASVRQDFGVNQGLRQASYGLGYSGQCISLAATASRSLTQRSSGDSATEIFFRIGFKNLGEFQTSGISVGGNDEDIEDDVVESE